MTNKTGFFKRLKALTLPQKKLFAIALCQRMYPNYLFFSTVCHFGDPKILDTLLNLLWQSMYDSKLKLNIDLQLNKLDENTPNPNDFDVYGVYPALDAIVSLSALLGAYESKIEDDITNISKLSSSTVAKYIEAISTTDLEGDALDDYIFAHEAMQQERELQAALLEIIEETPNLNAEFIKGLRKEIVTDAISNIGICINDINQS